MNDRQKKLKNTTNNINININLKVSSKNGQLLGKKISNNKQINHNYPNEMIRSNVTTQTLNKKKHSINEHNKHHKSIHQFIQENTITYENYAQGHQEDHLGDKKYAHYLHNKNSQRKKNKSKSLENLKIRYYQKTPDVVKKELKQKDKSKSKSKSKRKIKNQSPQSKGKSSKSNSRKKNYNKSLSKSKSKSKSPIVLKKKKSLQMFKIKDLQVNKQKQLNKRIEKPKQKTMINKKPIEQGKQKKNIQSSDLNIKRANQKIKSNRKSSVGRLKITKQAKQQTQIHKKNEKNPVSSSKSKKNSNAGRIYSYQYLQKMTIKVQSAIRGFMVRKFLKQQLTQITQKINSIKKDIDSKNSKFWESKSNNSNHSIQRLQNIEFELVEQEKKQKSFGYNKKITLQLQILRKRLQEQEDRFKKLAEENNQLKATIVNSQVISNPKSYKQKSSRDLGMNRNTISLRIKSEQSEKDNDQTNQNKFLKKQKLKQLSVAIKTQQSNVESSQYNLSSFKKQTQFFQCSPKNQNQKFKFNKQIIKKIFLKQQQKLNKKYSIKNIQYQQLLQNNMVSPKSYQFRKIQLQNNFQLQKNNTLQKFKQAEKALLLISQIQEENNIQIQNINQNNIKNQNQNKKQNKNIKQDKKQPNKKIFNLYINVDQIQLESNKYCPILSNNSHREPDKLQNSSNKLQNSSQEEINISNLSNLSNQYKKVMDEKMLSKKSDVYIEDQGKDYNFFNVSKNSPRIIQLQKSRQQQQNKQHQQQYIQKDKKGFDTNLRYLRSFYINFCQYIRSIKQYKSQVLQNLSTQIIFDSSLFLKTFRSKYIKDHSQQLVFPYFKLLAQYNSVIPSHILNSYYEELSNPDSQYFNEQCYTIKKTSRQQYQQLGFSYYQMKQHHDLALIDAFNQSLNKERPGGEQGSNLQFLTQKYYNINKNKVINKFDDSLQQTIRQENLDIVLGNSIGIVINNWASMLCGFINQEQNQEQKIQGSKLQEIRSIRQGIMLQKYIIEQQNTLINFELFDLAIRTDISQKIENIIIQQAIHDFNLLGWRIINK